MTFRRVIAGGAAALALVTGISIASAGTASAYTDGGGCRQPPVNADGLQVNTCVYGDGAAGIWTQVDTGGSNNTKITLCAEVVDSSQHVVPGSLNCQVVPGPNGEVFSGMAFPADGTYYGVAWFTSPTYYYGGETPPIHVYSIG